MIRLLICGIFLWPFLIRSQEVLEVPHTPTPPVIDGTLEPGVWNAAATLQDLEAAYGEGGELPPSVSTSVRVLWDEAALYVAFVCRDDRIRTDSGYRRDDNLYEQDVVEVFLHARGAPVPYYELVVSPLNQVLDAAHFLTEEAAYTDKGILSDPFLKKYFWTFRSWTWEGLVTATRRRRAKEGWIWTVEAKLPVGKILREQMRDTFRKGDVLRANFLRYDWNVDSKGDSVLRQTHWQPVQTGCPHISAGSMGQLRLVNDTVEPGKG